MCSSDLDIINAFILFRSGYESSTCLSKWKNNQQPPYIPPCRNFVLLTPPQLIIKTQSCFSIKVQPKLFVLLLFFFYNGGPDKAGQYTLRIRKIFQRSGSCCKSCTNGLCSLPESARQFDFQN